MGVVRHEEYGNPENPTIYYLTGYGSTLHQMRPHTGLLQVMGFRVMGFEYDKAILSAGDPSLLPDAMDEIKETVQADAETHRAAGIYGISLGGFIGFHVLKNTDIERGMFNTGGVSVLNTVWQSEGLKEEKKTFQAKGFTYESLTKIWQDIDKPAELQKDKKVILMMSDADKTLSPNESKQNFQKWIESGADAKLIVAKHLDHGPVIIRNLFRITKLAKFFKTKP